mmetsp:Transcript_47474/g.120482  ORF Transcript_47474/g.120482 Transcript_47474/m.120482 type:complete len:130 (+) Transcript_47474:830-1219(+)
MQPSWKQCPQESSRHALVVMDSRQIGQVVSSGAVDTVASDRRRRHKGPLPHAAPVGGADASDEVAETGGVIARRATSPSGVSGDLGRGGVGSSDPKESKLNTPACRAEADNRGSPGIDGCGWDEPERPD